MFRICTAFILLITACVVLSPSAQAQSPVPEPVPQQADKSRFTIPATDDGLPGAGPIRRYDWFKKVWMERRSKWAGEVNSKRASIVFLGDSIIQGWGDVEKVFSSCPVANRGINGDTTRGMLIRLQEDVIALKPKCVVMLMGTNDIVERAEPKTISDNIGLIVAKLKKHNAKLPIVICNVFPAGDKNGRPKEKIRAINKRISKIASGSPNVIELDTYALFAAENGLAKPAEFPDMLHPNKQGYAKWAASLRPLFETLGFVPAEPSEFKIEEGFEALFNGKDLTGWQVSPSTERDKKAAARWKKNNPDAPPWPIITESKSFNGKISTDDGRYIAMNERLIVTIPPSGRRIQKLFTERKFPEDFVLKLEFRATPNADSGVFLRGKQLQCRDYVTAGPYKELRNYRPQDWNELTITVKGDVAHCVCNNEVIEAEFKIPATGPIGIEGDRGQMEYRRIRIKTN